MISDQIVTHCEAASRNTSQLIRFDMFRAFGTPSMERARERTQSISNCNPISQVYNLKYFSEIMWVIQLRQ